MNVTVGTLTEATATYTYAGQDVVRHYFYYIPSTWKDGDRLPVVLSLHGSGENALMQLNEGNWVELAEEEGIVIIAPQAVALHADGTLSAEGRNQRDIGRNQAAYIRWYAAATDPIAPYGVDDVKYLTDLVSLFVEGGFADPGRVFSTGLSHGAFMSIRLAVEAPHKIAGIGAVAGLLSAEMAQKLTAKGVKLVFVNGTNDPIVPYNGMYYNGVAWAYSTDESIDRLLTAWGCPAVEMQEESLPDAHPDDGMRISRTAYVARNGSIPAVKYTVHGGGHTWPGGTQYLPARYIGPLCSDAQASRLIWNELKSVTLREG